MGKIWVQVVEPNGQFYQEVYSEPYGEDNRVDIIAEHVRAASVGARMVPVPVQVEDTAALRAALAERSPISKRGRLIVVEDPAVVAKAKADAEQAEANRVAGEQAAAAKKKADEDAAAKKAAEDEATKKAAADNKK